MIGAISLIRRRPDLDVAAFRRHWLDPHGVVTARLPRTRRYLQGHVVPSAATSPRAVENPIDGFAVLAFDTLEDRNAAYSSPEIRVCNTDSESFIGAVRRLVTEPVTVLEPPPGAAATKAYVLLLGEGGEDEAWSAAYADRVAGLAGVTGYIRQKIISQAGPPESRIVELAMPVRGMAEVWLEDAAALARNAAALADTDRTAVYVAEDRLFI